MVDSLYIHIPFCRRKCPYCDFYSVVYNDDIADSYIRVLNRQISSFDRKFSTIYVGGGTPSVLKPILLKRLLNSLNKHIETRGEFTVEVNPESLDKDKVKLFLDKGVNRISIGVQSLYNSKLNSLGRIHSSNQARNSVLLAKKAGFKNVSIDLIFGLAPESVKSWKKELSEAVNLPVNHISTYALTYEKNTLLHRDLQKKKISSLSERVVADMYRVALGYLPKKGFRHYEVSNFSQKRYICKHNLNYWQNSSYLGLGPSAVSYVQGRRQKNESDVRKYTEQADNNKNLVVFSERLSPLQRAKETAALKIRTKEGIDFAWFRRKTGFDFLEIESQALAELIENHLLRYKKTKRKTNTGVFLTKKGFVFCDTVSSSFL